LDVRFNLQRFNGRCMKAFDIARSSRLHLVV
jgi:hypothetical protein